jgi:hypothetical protein
MATYPNNAIQLPIHPGTLLPGVCFTNEQQRLNAFASTSYVELPANYSTVIASPNQPTVEQQNMVWFKVDSFNNVIGQFIFSSQYAKWVYPHYIVANDPRLVLFPGALSDISLLDGGDAGAITATTGSFWTIDNNWTDKLPIGAGTVPDGIDAQKFATGSAYPSLRGVFFIRRTNRIYQTP